MNGEGEMLTKSNEVNKVNEETVLCQTKKNSLSGNEYYEMKKQISDLIITNMNLSYANKELIDSNKNLIEQVKRKNSGGTE